MPFPQTEEEFIKREIDEWGFDYVEGQFARGYTPKFDKGIWEWSVAEGITPVSASTSTVPRTPVNLIVTIK